MMKMRIGSGGTLLMAAWLMAAAGCGASGSAGAAVPSQAPTTGGQANADGYPTSPPPPIEERPLAFPPFQESTLANGLRIIVVEHGQQPIANVSLFVESGSASDPPELAGLSGVLADMLTKGTPTRSAEEISREIEGVGGQLSVGSTSDNLEVSAGVLSDHLELAFELVSDVALRPTLPAEELELTRTRILTSLQAELASPQAVASRRFLTEIYGEGHPYERLPEPETVRAIDRAALQEFHARHFTPANALLVVSGDVSTGEAQALAERYLGEWSGEAVAKPAFTDPPAIEGTRIVLMHRPGSVQSAIRAGNTAILPDDPDRYALQVLNKVLGSGTDSRLFLILREQKGWTYGAYSSLSRPRGLGYLSATAEVRNEVTDSAVVELLHQLRRIRDEPVAAAELEAAKNFLTGSFPLQIETPAAVARQVAQVRLLGLPIESLTDHRERIAEVTDADVRRVAARHVRPENGVVVVVGDATQVMEGLQRIAPVTLLDIEGAPLDPAALEVRASGTAFDAERLEIGTRTYRVLVQGTPFGTARTVMDRQGDEWAGTTRLEAGPLAQTVEVRFARDFTPIALTSSASQGGMEMGSDLRHENGRVTGEIRLPEQMGGTRAVDTEVPAGTLFSGMDALALATAQLTVGETVAVPVFSEQSGSVVQATFEVVAEESITVAAGTFDALRVEVSAGPQSGTLWLRQEAPHTMLRQETAGQPIVIELESM